MYIKKWENEFGKFELNHNLSDSQGIRITNKFLQDIVNGIACNSCNQIENSFLIPPFAYREKQFHTVMAPSIKESSEYFLMESPVNRNWRDVDIKLDNKHGWVDYWCTRNDYDYYFEVKHGFKSYNSEGIRICEIEKWNDACKQLETLNDEMSSQRGYTRGIFRVAFHVMPIYIGSNSLEKLETKSISLENYLKKYNHKISSSYDSNWSCLWTLPTKLDKVYEFTNGFERYPAVLFFVRVYDLVL